MAPSPLGVLDHASWVFDDGAKGRKAFRRLGFALSPKTKVQSDGSRSTFVTFSDRTYLEIVESHTKDDRAYIASGANPEGAGGLVAGCTSAAHTLRSHGVRMSVGRGAGFCFAAFPADDSLLSTIFLYSYGAAAPSGTRSAETRYARHPNGTLGVREIWIAVPDLAQAVDRFTNAGFPTIVPSMTVEALAARGTALAWGSHRILLVQATGPVGPLGDPVARLGAHPVGVRLAADMTAVRRIVAPIATQLGDALLVAPANAAGAWIAFAPPDTWTE